MILINQSLPKKQSFVPEKKLILKKGLSGTLNTDSKVNTHAFSPTFDMESFIEFVFTNVLMLMTQGTHSCGFFIGTIRQIIYT